MKFKDACELVNAEGLGVMLDGELVKEFRYVKQGEREVLSYQNHPVTPQLPDKHSVRHWHEVVRLVNTQMFGEFIEFDADIEVNPYIDADVAIASTNHSVHRIHFLGLKQP